MICEAKVEKLFLNQRYFPLVNFPKNDKCEYLKTEPKGTRTLKLKQLKGKEKTKLKVSSFIGEEGFAGAAEATNKIPIEKKKRKSNRYHNYLISLSFSKYLRD